MGTNYVDIEDVIRALENELVEDRHNLDEPGLAMARKFIKRMEETRMMSGWAFSAEVLLKLAVAEFVRDIIDQAAENLKHRQ